MFHANGVAGSEVFELNTLREPAHTESGGSLSTAGSPAA
jgi:hypothetical protein